MRTIRWGIIGCGDVTEVKSGPALQKAANSRLVAVMRRDGAKAADYAKRHGVPRWYDDADALIWAGARGGRAHALRPLPASFGDHTCAFRPVALEALTRAEIDWRTVCETSNMEPLFATLEADLAVAPLLSSTVPDNLAVLGKDSGLPPLPMFTINLYLPRTGASEVAAELARRIREQFAVRYRQAA